MGPDVGIGMEGVTVRLTRGRWLWNLVEMLWMPSKRQKFQIPEDRDCQALIIAEDGDERRGENIRMKRNGQKGAWVFGSVAQCYVGQWTMPCEEGASEPQTDRHPARRPREGGTTAIRRN